MDTVVVKPLFHRNRECIGLYFDKNQALNVLIRRITGIKWSQTNKCWYVPQTRESYIQLKTLLQEHVIQVIQINKGKETVDSLFRYSQNNFK